ncbi:hypothetical protein GCM10007063_25220 [Lentibacillus kapialis]|uniref:Uncharacterized protein n=1 Tax=Lentibacillus kapialis TaxID=340214 RepID=A0A917UZ62_9BACI|nr:hypothetical protein GCM10007063_25220 [Lentibacillus kapialis]
METIASIQKRPPSLIYSDYAPIYSDSLSFFSDFRAVYSDYSPNYSGALKNSVIPVRLREGVAMFVSYKVIHNLFFLTLKKARITM